MYLKNATHSKYITNIAIFVVPIIIIITYLLTKENPSELKNALTQYWSLYYTQNTWAVLMMRKQIPCNLNSTGRIYQHFMSIFECLLKYWFPSPSRKSTESESPREGLQVTCLTDSHMILAIWKVLSDQLCRQKHIIQDRIGWVLVLKEM